jgi:hypothetical protein
MYRATTSFPVPDSGDEDGRLGVRDLRRVRQHVLPLGRLTQDAMASTALDFIDKCANALLEQIRALLSLRSTTAFFRQLLMRQGQRDMVRYARGQHDVIVAVRKRLVRSK